MIIEIKQSRAYPENTWKNLWSDIICTILLSSKTIVCNRHGSRIAYFKEFPMHILEVDVIRYPNIYYVKEVHKNARLNLPAMCRRNEKGVL